MLWLQKTPWDKLVPADFITIMPNPRYNQLSRPVKLPPEMYDEMFLHVYWYITMYLEYRNYGLKPWETSGGIVYTSDIKCLEMMEQMVKDAQEVDRRMAEAKAKTDAELRSKYGNTTGAQQQNVNTPRRKTFSRRQ